MPEEKEGTSLKLLIDGILKALRDAKERGDAESVKLYEMYKKEPALSSFTIPAFTISDVDIELRFSVSGTAGITNSDNKIPDLMINITPESLKGLEPHHISQMKLKISPTDLRILEESE